MAIRAPGGGAGLSGFALGKHQLRARTKKSLSQSLNLTAMVDFMSVIVIFLLMNFSASGDTFYQDVRLPSATVGEEVERVPVVTVSVNGITLEGKLVADSQTVLQDEGETGLETLEAELLAEKDAFKSVRQGESFDGKVVIAADEHVPYKLVRRVFNIAAKAGYVRVNYVVRLAAKPH